jgi:hypothetical protein
MTLELSVLELAIAQQLDPLRQALRDYGIPLAALPKLAGAYSEDEEGAIAIFIPSATGITNDPLALTAQDAEINVSINISLGKRYQDVEGEKDVLEWCCDQVIGLLLGFSPYPSEVMKRPLYFKGYELFKPNNDRWEGQVNFACVKQIRSIPFAEEYEVIKVQLLASLNLMTGTVVSEMVQRV